MFKQMTVKEAEISSQTSASQYLGHPMGILLARVTHI